ncbi:MAG: peptidase U32 family protein [Candidatus Omnitrophota bacterium]
MKRRIELVSPAGDWSSLIAAVQSGADSVYFGVKDINLRRLADNFDVLEIKKIISFLHERDKKGYLALNSIVMNSDLTRINRILKEAKSARVDGVILWDMAVFSLAEKAGLPVHLSTQASISNSEAAAFFAARGVKRIILARECTLEDIKEIIGHIKGINLDCEVEVFIHGAMCISISGRCFLSQHTYGKSANRGYCLQPCRREFQIKDSQDDSEYIIGRDYLLSSKDLCTIDFIDTLIEAGIRAFKIEGRMRSPEYSKVVTSVYRRAIDSYFSNTLSQNEKKSFKEELTAVYNRGFCNGFYLGPSRDWQSKGIEQTHKKIFLGEVRKVYKRIEVAEILLQNGSLKKGEDILFIGKKTPASVVKAEQLQQNHRFVEKADRGSCVGVKIPFTVKPKDKVFRWRKKGDKIL